MPTLGAQRSPRISTARLAAARYCAETAALAHLARLEWYAQRRKARESAEVARISEAREAALTARLREAPGQPAASAPRPELEILQAITRGYDATEVYPGGTSLSGPGFRARGEVEGSTPGIYTGNPESTEAGPGHGVGADADPRRVLCSSSARGAEGDELPGPRVQRLPPATKEMLEELAYQRAEETRRKRGYKSKPRRGEGGTAVASSSEQKGTSSPLVRRRKLADGTWEEVEVPRRKK